MAALANLPGFSRTARADTISRPLIEAVRPSPRMPVLFIGHGSPMNAIADNEWRRSWQALGAELLAREAMPQVILCISAHWLTRGSWQITGMAQPKTIHDFGGFPQELFDQEYASQGAPGVAKALARELNSLSDGTSLILDTDGWGLDHGTWSVLKPMFPKADIPVLQLSMDYSRPPTEHYALGRKLQTLRDRGVLIVGSGNIVHHLRATGPGTPVNGAFDWAREFDSVVHEQIKSGQLDALQNFQALGALARQAHPTHEHFLPLLYASGAAHSTEMPRIFNTGFQSAAVSMQSIMWG